MVDHGVDRVRSAERLGGLGVLAAALLGQGAGFVFGLAGLQGGLLRQLQRFHRRRRPTMITLKPGWQLPMPFLDQHPPRRPTFIKGRVDPDDLPRRTLPRISGGPIREPHLPAGRAGDAQGRCCEVSDAATAALNSTRPSIKS